MIDLSKLMTAAQAARAAGCTRQAVCLAAREGRLVPAAKLPGPLGAYLFERREVDAWIARGVRGRAVYGSVPR